MNNPIFVISLKKAEDRRENINQQFKKLNIKFDFFEGINGNEGQHALFAKYNEKNLKKIRANKLNNGQLGCYASHYLLWEKCIELNKPILVIEDDATFSENTFIDFYNDIDNLSPRFECIRLFQNMSKNNRHIVIEKKSTYSIAKFTKGHMRATGYYLTPQGAEKFLSRAQEWTVPVDIYMDRFWFNNVECYGLLPPCIDNDPIFVSQINVETKKRKRTIYEKALREKFAFSESIKRSIWNTKFRIKNLAR